MSETKTPHLGLRTALVVDDHEIYRSAVARILQKSCAFTEVFESGSLADARHRFGRDGQIAFAVLGIYFEPGSDYAAIKQLRDDHPDLTVVVMSGSLDRRDMISALAAGAQGYVPKSIPLSEVTAALNAVAMGTIYLPWSVSDLSPRRPPANVREPHRPKVRLTTRQADVLRLIRARKSNREIALELGLTEGTVKVHANALFRALGVASRSAAASFEMD